MPQHGYGVDAKFIRNNMGRGGGGGCVGDKFVGIRNQALCLDRVGCNKLGTAISVFGVGVRRVTWWESI